MGMNTKKLTRQSLEAFKNSTDCVVYPGTRRVSYWKGYFYNFFMMDSVVVYWCATRI